MSIATTKPRGLGALAALLAIVVLVNATRTYVVPEDWHFAYNVLLAGCSMGLALVAGLRADSLGLSRSSLGDGLRLGGIAFGVISALVVIGGLTGVVSDTRVDTGVGSMLWRVLVVIPVGTVVVEELIFRSALHGLLSTVLRPVPAMAVGSVLFGLWHVLPAAN
ncbi:MAG: CPBP family intramembrane metalloprotease, partial [Microthrixaceae bacterium]|nr:CPBP family intramembrane metalloprotease [Microthrixaceae bacterium]